MRSRIIAAVLAVSIAGVPILVAEPASAATTPATAASPDFTPSPNKFRQFMLNVTSGILGKSTPNSWRAEQLANEHRYNHSWEQWEAEVGIPGDIPEGQLITDGYFTTPQTKADYDLKKAQQALKGGKNGKPLRPPATKTQKLTKGIGGAINIIGGAALGISVGFEAGKAISTAFGFDVEGGLCNPDGIDGGFLGALTGTDCSYLEFDAEYARNQDAATGITWNSVCTTGGRCIKPVGTASGTATDLPHYQRTCVIAEGTAPTAGNSVFVFVKYGGGQTGTSTLRGGVLTSAGEASAQQCFNAYGTRVTLLPIANSAGNTIMPEQAVFRFAESIGLGYGATQAAAMGNAQYTPRQDPNPNPNRTLTCEIVGDDGNTYTANSAVYTESGAGLPSPKCPALPPGVFPDRTKITSDSPKGKDTYYDEKVTDEYKQWWTLYPECRTGACRLDLLIDTPPAPKSCFDVADLCVDWFKMPDKADKFTCKYGRHVVALKECNVYAGIFVPGRIEACSPYSDPLTGTWSGGRNSECIGDGVLNTPVKDPTLYRNCENAKKWTLDIMYASMSAARCVLEWAFVPRPAIVTATAAQLNSQWGATPPAKLVGIITGLSISVQVDGCSGVPLPLPFGDFFGHMEPIRFGNACPGTPLAPIAGTLSLVIGMLCTWGAFTRVTSDVAGVVNYRGLS